MICSFKRCFRLISSKIDFSCWNKPKAGLRIKPNTVGEQCSGATLKRPDTW